MEQDGLLSPFLLFLRSRKIGREIKEMRGKKILDLGCGRAPVSRFVENSNLYCGVDKNEPTIKLSAEQYPQWRFFNADAGEWLAGSREKFDIILAAAFLEHIDLSGDFIGLIADRINADGFLIVTTPHPSIERIYNAGAFFGLFSRAACREHKKLLCLADLEKKIVAAGLILVKYEKFEFGFNQLFIFQK